MYDLPSQEPRDFEVAECVRAWAAAVAALASRPASTARVERWLTALTRRLVAVLDGEPFSTEPAREVGAALVEANLTDPEVLNKTIEVLGEYLPACAGGADDEVLARLVRMLGAFGAGFADALRRRVMADQAGLAPITALREPAGRISPADPGRFRRAFDNAAIGIAFADLHGRITEANQALADLVGYDVTDLLGAELTSLAHRDDAAAVGEQIRRLLYATVSDMVRFERRLIHRDRGVRWVGLALSLIRDAAGDPTGMVVMAHDVTDHHHAQLQLRHQAFHDPLTGLPNRALLAERIHRLFATAVAGSRAALCFVDLDGFKAINDSLGHDVGDRLLAAAAARINGCVADNGHLVARLGGDEFVILISESAAPGVAVGVAERVLQALEAPFRIEEQELWISASIGIVERPVATASPAELLRAADVTMQRAKANGKGRWTLFDPHSHSTVATRANFGAPAAAGDAPASAASRPRTPGVA